METTASRTALIHKIISILEVLPKEKLKVVRDFTDFLLQKNDDLELQRGMEKLMNQSDVFDFLKEDEALYSTKDLKEKF